MSASPPPNVSSVLGWADVRAHGAKGDGATDDTAAIQASIAACAAAGGGTVYFPAGTYLLAGTNAATVTGSCQLVLPARDLSSPVIPIRLIGPVPQSHGPMVVGLSGLAIPTGGAVLVSTATGGAILGGAAPAGNSSANFTMVHLTVEDLTFRTADNPNQTALDLGYVACVRLTDVICDTGVYQLGLATQPTHANAYGCILPRVQNGAFSVVNGLMVVGYYTGVRLGEHAEGRLSVWSCLRGVEVGPENHAMRLDRLGDYDCAYGIYCTAAGAPHPRLDVGQHAIERAPSGWQGRVADVYDPSNCLYGSSRYAAVLGGTGPVSTYTKTGGTNFSATDIGE